MCLKCHLPVPAWPWLLRVAHSILHELEHQLPPPTPPCYPEPLMGSRHIPAAQPGLSVWVDTDPSQPHKGIPSSQKGLPHTPPCPRRLHVSFPFLLPGPLACTNSDTTLHSNTMFEHCLHFLSYWSMNPSMESMMHFLIWYSDCCTVKWMGAK